MNTQPDALRLADILEQRIPSVICLEVAAAELRRLHEENIALRQAIEQAEKEATLQEITDIGQWDTSDMAHRAGGLSVEQEPVARFNWNEAKFEWLTEYSYEKHHMKPLYLAPPKREWRGLTAQDYHKVLNLGGFAAFKAIEAILRERNQ
jgi:hypothetical protein